MDDYFRSSLEDKLLVYAQLSLTYRCFDMWSNIISLLISLPCTLACRKMPEKDAEYLTPATRLLEKKREMAEVEDALSTTKEVSSNL